MTTDPGTTDPGTTDPGTTDPGTTDPGTTDPDSERIVCGSCESVPDDPQRARLSWSFGIERGRRTWTCVACSRRHLRGIEGKLDSDWW